MRFFVLSNEDKGTFFIPNIIVTFIVSVTIISRMPLRRTPKNIIFAEAKSKPLHKTSLSFVAIALIASLRNYDEEKNKF